MSRREMTVRKTTLEGADDERRDREFWLTVPPDQRFFYVFEMSEESLAFSQNASPDPEGRARSVARVLRP